MSTIRVFAILLVLLAGLETAASKDNAWLLQAPDLVMAPSINLPESISGGNGALAPERIAQQNGEQVIPPSMALRLALSYSPGSQGLGVDLVQDRRLVYAVKLKTGNRVHRVLVDARTGQILGE